MPNEIEDQIIFAGVRLRPAMLASDFEAFAELISPDLILTNRMGHVFSKHYDLALHRSGPLKLQTL